jgi:hypothetical protein
MLGNVVWQWKSVVKLVQSTDVYSCNVSSWIPIYMWVDGQIRRAGWVEAHQAA